MPQVQFLYRYDAGDYDSLCGALEEMIRDVEPVNVASLRGVVARYTLEAWCGDHEDAFEDAFGERRFAESPLASWRGKAGVYYVAYGDPARECARKAVASWKRHMPGVPVAVASDVALGAGEDHMVITPDDDVGARSVKTKIWDLAPGEWQYVLYLDADTEIVADVGFLFDLLADGWEWVMCTNPAQYHLAREMSRPDNKEELAETFKLLGTDEVLQLNGGVFAFRRNPRTERLMKSWHREWNRWAMRDQAALDRALYSHPVKLYVLGNEWNTVTRYIDASRTAGILHYPLTARRWRGILPGNLRSKESWASLHPAGR